MNISGLSFNALPPINLPFRFFLTSPIFMLASAGLILFAGEDLWVSRWHPYMLALTHSFTLGFLTMVMMGALLQLLPVIAGIGIAKPRLTASFSHFFLTLGCLSLILSFISSKYWLIYCAMLCLFASLGLYLTAIGWVLIKKISQGNSITGFRLAIIALAITLFIGLALLSNNLGVAILPGDKHTTNIHALWGLVGWAGLLIIAVSFQVIPMFHVAPSFPKLVMKYLTGSIFLLLILFILMPRLAMPLLFISHGVFSASLLWVIKQRKRKVPDTSIRYWQLGASSLLVLNIIYFIPDNLFPDAISERKTLLLTALFIYFYLLSVIEGMLLKILPFLSYTHLQQRCLMDFTAMQYLPNMHEFLSKAHGKYLLILHSLAGVSLLIVIIEPRLYSLFGILLILEFSWLLLLMIRTMKLYFTTEKKINREIKQNSQQDQKNSLAV
jgi:hypothetical protein